MPSLIKGGFNQPRAGSAARKDQTLLSKSGTGLSKGGLGVGVTPFMRKKENVEDKARINELHRQMEENAQQILLQKLEIRQLKDQIIRLMEEKGFHASGGANVLG